MSMRGRLPFVCSVAQMRQLQRTTVEGRRRPVPRNGPGRSINRSAWQRKAKDDPVGGTEPPQRLTALVSGKKVRRTNYEKLVVPNALEKIAWWPSGDRCRPSGQVRPAPEQHQDSPAAILARLQTVVHMPTPCFAR